MLMGRQIEMEKTSIQECSCSKDETNHANKFIYDFGTYDQNIVTYVLLNDLEQIIWSCSYKSLNLMELQKLRIDIETICLIDINHESEFPNINKLKDIIMNSKITFEECRINLNEIV